MAAKKCRSLKVYEQSGYNYKPTPSIHLQGQWLKEIGFESGKYIQVKCGVGKCGRCNIGSKYVCKDGPVFRFDEIDELPNEY